MNMPSKELSPTLADKILSRVRCEEDHHLLGGVSLLAAQLIDAERYVLDRDFVRAAKSLYLNRPENLIKAMPLCRAPHKKMWVEYVAADIAPEGATQREATEIPNRIGFLLECNLDADPGQRICVISWAWDSQSTDFVSISMLGHLVDWSVDPTFFEEQGVRYNAKNPLDCHPEIRELLSPAMQRMVDNHRDFRPKIRSKHSLREWVEMNHLNPGEKASDEMVDAYYIMQQHARLSFNPNAIPLLNMGSERNPHHYLDQIPAWIADIDTELPLAQSIVALLNSKNCVETEPRNTEAELGKLNRRRMERGRAPILPHVVTKLKMTKTQSNRVANTSETREASRAHLVAGHFKIRKTGIYWWMPFFRGDSANPGPRSHYHT
jgi:hypothetical protein